MVRHRMLAPIMSIKHYVYRTLLLVTGGTLIVQPVAEGVVAPATANAHDVIQGSNLKAVYIELWIIGSGAAGTVSTFTVALEKVPANAPAMTFTNIVNLGAYLNKKNVLFTSQGLLATSSSGSPTPFMRQWIAIPKGKQRMGLSDKISLNIASSGAGDIQVCGFFTYKEYR